MFDLALPFAESLIASASMSFDDLVERHKTMVYRTAWRMLGSPNDAEDICQEVFLRLHKHQTLDQPLSTWLYRVTVNLCLDRIRRRRPLVEDVVLLTLPGALPSPEERQSTNEQLVRLARFIARLPEVERASLVLRDLEGLNSREVAAILDTSEATVRTSIHRAKEKLRQWMT